MPRKEYIFQSSLSPYMNSFLIFREKQGKGIEETRRVLYDLDQFIVKNLCVDETHIERNIIENWSLSLSAKVSSQSVAAYLSLYKAFAKYLGLQGIKLFIPENPIVKTEYEAYVFSEDEINRIITYSDNQYIGPETIFWEKYSVLLRLLYGTGMRISEGINLTTKDLDPKGEYFIVRRAKGNKDRIVVLHPTLREVIRKHLELINDSTYLFSKDGVKPYSIRWAQMMFSMVLDGSGVADKMPKAKGRKGFNIHCLRHTFAVHSIRNMIKNGIDVYSEIPILSIYMGHEDPQGTEQYLHLAGEVHLDIAEMMKDYNSGIFPEIEDYEKE
ncbi:MAG: tyrosine-type recombinase/integrase [Solobacterium sp.]|nr:tyrosine-type recombinase/integrase [Solobacterium sp.]